MNDQKTKLPPLPAHTISGPAGTGDYFNGHTDAAITEFGQACYAAALADQAGEQKPVSVEVKRNRVWIVSGVQSFMLAYEADTDEELQWYAGQLRAVLSGITPDVKSGEQKPVACRDADIEKIRRIADRIDWREVEWDYVAQESFARQVIQEFASQPADERLRERVEAALEASKTGHGSYGPNFNGNKLADLLFTALRGAT